MTRADGSADRCVPGGSYCREGAELDRIVHARLNEHLASRNRSLWKVKAAIIDLSAHVRRCAPNLESHVDNPSFGAEQ